MAVSECLGLLLRRAALRVRVHICVTFCKTNLCKPRKPGFFCSKGLYGCDTIRLLLVMHVCVHKSGHGRKTERFGLTQELTKRVYIFNLCFCTFYSGFCLQDLFILTLILTWHMKLIHLNYLPAHEVQRQWWFENILINQQFKAIMPSLNIFKRTKYLF